MKVKARTEGQRLLAEVPGSLARIARDLGVKSKQSILDWKSGNRVPTLAMRRKMFDAYGIPLRAWGVEPTAAKPQAKAEVAPEVDNEETVTKTTLEHCVALLGVISKDRQQQGLLANERVKLADAEARILALRHRLESESQLSEDRFVREHPAWLRLKRTIVDALVPFPAAAQAVAEAIRRSGM